MHALYLIQMLKERKKRTLKKKGWVKIDCLGKKDFFTIQVHHSIKCFLC